ncbi:MAG: T9SS type A sorting domain-containing protein [bacterium]|nr:T9SS type A sorting domain-containing protein [bacterium]
MASRLVFLLSLVLAVPAFSQPNPDTLWTRTYDLGGAESGYAVAPVPQGGYVVVGRTWGMNPTHTFFLKVGNDGYSTERRTITVADETDGAQDVYPYPDGSRYILCGWLHTADSRTDIYIMKTYWDGVPEWTQTFGEYGNDETIFSMCPADDGGFLLAGWTVSHGTYAYIGYIAKVNSDGIFQWSRTYEAMDITGIPRIIPAANDTYVFVGAHGLSSDGISLVKINAVGDTLWIRTYVELPEQSPCDVAVLPDGGFAVVGTTGYVNGEILLIRTDASGDTLWTRAIGDTLYNMATSVVPGPAGGLVLVGSTSAGEMYEDLHLIGVDASGNEIWRRTWNQTVNNYLDRVLVTSDGGYLVLANKIPGNSNDVYLIKTGPDQGAGADEPRFLMPDQLALSVYPNPFNSEARIAFALSQPGPVEMNLYNLTGQRVATLANGIYAPGEHAVMLQGGGLSSGTYFIRAEAAQSRQVKKIVLMK